MKTKAVSSAEDPFAFLEDGAAPATVRWTDEQNARTRRLLGALPQHAVLARRFEDLTSIDDIDAPVERGGGLFFTARGGSDEQPRLYVETAGAERVLFDPARYDESGLTALDWWYPSPAGNFIALGLSRGGDEKSTLHVLATADAALLAEAIPDTRYCSLAWLPGEDGFYYTRLPPGENYRPRVYRHALGSEWRSDPLVFGEGRAPEDMLEVVLSANGRWLVAVANRGWIASDVFLCDLSLAQPEFRALVEGNDARYGVRTYGDRLLVVTNEGAPHGRVFEVDATNPARERWREVVPERAGALEAMAVSRDALALAYLEDVQSTVLLRDWSGGTMSLPLEPATGVTTLSAHESSPEIFVRHVGFFRAPLVERVALGGNELTRSSWRRVIAPFDERAYAVEQTWFPSRDGTRVPMYVMRRTDAARDVPAPAVLYGYGGFNISLGPAFSPTLVPWLDAGGVFAIANLRGGGEFGEPWHRAGMRERKQNVFDDFIAAAEALVCEGWADPSRLASFGGSNGGLLVAATMVQRPDLFRAVCCEVPLTDMLRYHHFEIGRLWIGEYGDPDVPADAAFLRAYSPYHNVRDGVSYPALFVFSAASDTRVDPLHARKFGARVQAATASDRPVLIEIQSDAGHGAGKPRALQIQELADRWSFLCWQLNVEP